MGTADSGDHTGGARQQFLYDGDCAFCSACARFMMRRIPTPARIVAWQFTDLGELGLTAAQCDESVQWVAFDAAGRRYAASGPVAIAALLRTSGRGWRAVGGLLAVRPVLAIAWPVYRFIARHRDKMPGGTPTCALPADQRPVTARRLPATDPSVITLRNIDHSE
jgi:predicted DCC family thiol-disulfide oxidoreductase YuxK